MTYWTNPSAIKLAGDNDPVDVIQKKAREVVLSAIQDGWAGPPFDPFELAKYLSIPVTPREDIQDARTIPVGGRGLRVEFNPNKPPGRIRFSMAHEIGHTLFPDCAETVRTRGRAQREDSWQLELLCNLAAAEILMPIGTAMDIDREPVRIDNILRLQRQYDVSTEAICLRMIRLTRERCTFFAATRTSPALSATSDYRVDYSVPSRASKTIVPQGFEFSDPTVMSQCTAVGFTAKGTERWSDALPEAYVECVGIPPYPGQYFPRIVGILEFGERAEASTRQIRYLRGDALQPRGNGCQIIAHVVNDKTSNWGGLGFAQAIKKWFPSVQRGFRQWVSSDPENLSLGRVHLTEVAPDLIIVSMIAQHGYGPSRKPRIRYSVLRNCLDQLAEIAVTRAASIHVPRIGTGEARGKWPIIAELIDETLIQRSINVTVYRLPSSELLEETQGPLPLGAAVQSLKE